MFPREHSAVRIQTQELPHKCSRRNILSAATNGYVRLEGRQIRGGNAMFLREHSTGFWLAVTFPDWKTQAALPPHDTAEPAFLLGARLGIDNLGFARSVPAGTLSRGWMILWGMTRWRDELGELWGGNILRRIMRNREMFPREHCGKLIQCGRGSTPSSHFWSPQIVQPAYETNSRGR